MIINKGRFKIKFGNKDLNFIENFQLDSLEKSYQEIKKFFRYKGDLPKIKINLIHSPEEFEFFTGRKHENWISAMTGNNTTIHIFAPSSIEKHAIHKKESVARTIIHEISHFFYGYLRLPRIPLFDEGIAKYFQENECKNKINFKISKIKDNVDVRYIYGVGHLIIDCLVKYLGDEAGPKIVDFLKSLNETDTDEEIIKKFENNFEININSLIELKECISK